MCDTVQRDLGPNIFHDPWRGGVSSKILSFQRLASRCNAPPKRKDYHHYYHYYHHHHHHHHHHHIHPPRPSTPLSLHFNHYHHYSLLSSPPSLPFFPSSSILHSSTPPKKGAIRRACSLSYSINCNRLAFLSQSFLVFASTESHKSSIPHYLPSRNL